MKLIRGLAGAVLWLLACVLGLVAVVLCVTIILLPLGVVLMGQSRKLFQLATTLMLPRAVRHPVKEARRQSKKKTRKTKRQLRRSEPVRAARKRGRRWSKAVSS